MSRFSRVKSVGLPLGVAFLTILGFGLTGCTYTQIAPPPPGTEYVEYTEPPPLYYDGPFVSLSSWGSWIETPRFGWVWQPYGPANWQPYDYGNWMWTQWGWTWVSYEPFGWATYHYGFWYYDAIYGWIWLPDNQWFPCRVSWMHYGDYVYWAPIPPPGYYIPDPWAIHSDFIWVGVSVDHFMQSDIGRYRIKNPTDPWARVPRGQIRRDAPSVEDIEQRTRSRIRVIDATKHKVKIGGREYEQMILPPAEQKLIERHEKRREETLRPQTRPKAQSKEEARPTQPSKQPEKQPQAKPAKQPEKQPAKQPEKREPQPKSKSKGGESKKGTQDKDKGKGKGNGK